MTTPSVGARISLRSRRPAAPRADSVLTAIRAATWLRSFSAAHGGAGAGDRLVGGGEPALDVDQLAPGGQQFGLRDDVARRERLQHFDIALGKGDAAAERAGGRLRLAKVAAALLDRGAERRDARLQRRSADLLERLLLGADLGHAAVGTGRAGAAAALAFGAEPRCAGLEGAILGLDPGQSGRAFGVVEPDQQLAAPDHLAGADQDLADRRRLGGLDLLDAAGRDHLALAAGDLVDLGERGPDQEEEEADRADQYDQARAADGRQAADDRGRPAARRAGEIGHCVPPVLGGAEASAAVRSLWRPTALA